MRPGHACRFRGFLYASGYRAKQTCSCAAFSLHALGLLGTCLYVPAYGWEGSGFETGLNFERRCSKLRLDVQAFADSWAVGYDCDNKCDVDAETATESFGEVLAVAASHAYGSICVGAPPPPACMQSASNVHRRTSGSRNCSRLRCTVRLNFCEIVQCGSSCL